MSSPFRIAVINDEITQDFGRAVEVVSKEFRLQWIELRGMWNKNILRLDSNEVAEARRLLERARLRVTDIEAPCSKWTGQGRLRQSSARRNAILSMRTSPSSNRTR